MASERVLKAIEAYGERTRELEEARRLMGTSERDEWLRRYQHALKALDKCDLQVKAAEARERALREALTRCRAQFRLYVEIHEKKGEDGIEKAARNRYFVALCDAALASPPSPTQEPADGQQL